MKRVWYLSTCDTCMRILSELSLKEKDFELIDVKIRIISADELDMIKDSLECSYEDLFNKRSIKYSKTNLKEKLKSDNDFREAILEEYTFMKRPIIEIDGKFFVGNAKKTVECAKKALL